MSAAREERLVAAAASLDAASATEAEHDIMLPPAAAAMAGKSIDTVRLWAKKHRLGRKLGGTWIVYRSRLVAFLRDRP
jgi:hypothetical protein